MIEFTLGEPVTSRELTARPNSFEIAGATLKDGRTIYTALGLRADVARVSVGALLAARSSP